MVLRTAFPDLRFEIDDLVSDGDRVGSALRNADHGGTFADVAPTGTAGCVDRVRLVPPPFGPAH